MSAKSDKKFFSIKKKKKKKSHKIIMAHNAKFGT